MTDGLIMMAQVPVDGNGRKVILISLKDPHCFCISTDLLGFFRESNNPVSKSMVCIIEFGQIYQINRETFVKKNLSIYLIINCLI